MKNLRKRPSSYTRSKSRRTSSSFLAGLIWEKPKWVNTSGFIHPAVAKNVISQDIQPAVEDSSSLKKVEKEENDVNLEHPVGQKAAKLHHILTDKQASADERTAMALELHVESHKVSKMGDSKIAKQWLQMAKEALLEKKKKLTEKNRSCRATRSLRSKGFEEVIATNCYQVWLKHIGIISSVKCRSRGRISTIGR
jgi:hypothetical protein